MAKTVRFFYIPTNDELHGTRGIMHDGEQFLTPEELTQRYKGRISLRTLANWRSTGDGPIYTKIGGRVLYALSAVKNWEQSRRARQDRAKESGWHSSMLPGLVSGYAVASQLVWLEIFASPLY
jgi:hypothetical protein